MNVKLVAIGIVAIMVVAGAGTAVFLLNNDKGDDKSILTHRLMVMGNVYSDDTLNSDDVKVLEAVVAGEKTIKIKDNDIDLEDAFLKKYADVNQDKNVDSTDVDALKNIIDGNVTALYYENAKGDILSVKVPINNLVVMFRRVGTTIAMVGASDMVKGFISDLASGGNYGFLGFKGTDIGTQGDPDYEKIKELNKNCASTGGITIISDATGAAADIEEKIGSGIDVVRMPVTEMGKSENGVVTLGYLLAYKNANHDSIMEKLNKWIKWNDDAKSKIDAAVKKLTDEDKKSCIISMYNASAASATINVRGPGVSEYEYTVYCGGKNLTTGTGGSYTPSDFNEYILSLKPEYTFIMQQEVYLLKNKISAETTYNELMENISKNYNGKVGVFSQFFGTGPGYVLSLMYYASVLVPELKDTFDIDKEYKYFMGNLVGNEDLANIKAFVMIQ